MNNYNQEILYEHIFLDFPSVLYIYTYKTEYNLISLEPQFPLFTSSLTPFFCLSIKLSIHPLIPLFTHILIEALICSDSLQNHQVLQWMKSWPKVTSMYPQNLQCITPEPWLFLHEAMLLLITLHVYFFGSQHQKEKRNKPLILRYWYVKNKMLEVWHSGNKVMVL